MSTVLTYHLESKNCSKVNLCKLICIYRIDHVTLQFVITTRIKTAITNFRILKDALLDNIRQKMSKHGMRKSEL